MIKVLNYGHVLLVDSMGNDLSISRAARVSYNAQGRPEDEKLIKYLWKNKHTTPFEAVTFTFDVKAPIFVFRQWHRHRTWSFNELSARYREIAGEFYLPDPRLIGTQSASSKQARDITLEHDYQKRKNETDFAGSTMVDAYHAYEQLLKSGWPRELARTVLPLATYSHMQATVNLLNLMKFLTLRTHEHAQYEIRVYAQAMLELVRPIVPIAIAAWEENNG